MSLISTAISSSLLWVWWNPWIITIRVASLAAELVRVAEIELAVVEDRLHVR
jgi:hypothetical protein